MKNVKKCIYLILTGFTLTLCACSKKTASLAEVTPQTAQKQVQTAPTASVQSADTSSPVDIDLTRMNANMTYAEVFNMLIEPEFYEGKTVRIRGSLHIPEQLEGAPPYSCIVWDATACCPAGLGFYLADDADITMPKEDEIITVVGTYTCTELDGFSTISLINCILES